MAPSLGGFVSSDTETEAKHQVQGQEEGTGDLFNKGEADGQEEKGLDTGGEGGPLHCRCS